MHRKLLRRYHSVGDLHELTFSCYRRLPLLTNNAWRREFARAIDEAGATYQLQLVAFVFMPEHVHLLGIKRPVALLAKTDRLC